MNELRNWGHIHWPINSSTFKCKYANYVALQGRDRHSYAYAPIVYRACRILGRFLKKNRSPESIIFACQSSWLLRQYFQFHIIPWFNFNVTFHEASSWSKLLYFLCWKKPVAIHFSYYTSLTFFWRKQISMPKSKAAQCFHQLLQQRVRADPDHHHHLRSQRRLVLLKTHN